MIRILLPCVVFFVIASSASAQIIYEPVQYQHGGQNTYYYGGSDPLMHRYAQSVRNDVGTYGRVNGFDFVSANIDTHREVTGEPSRVFSDALGLRNVRIHGYTAADARNDAYNAAPTYFRKADLLGWAHRDADGTVVVPAQAPSAGSARIYNVLPSRTVAPARVPLGVLRPLMIIPKDRLQRDKPTTGKVASGAGE